MSVQTEISVIFDHADIPIEEKLSDNTLSKSIVDLSLSLETRIEAINRYFVKEGSGNTIEVINKLGMMYELSCTKILQQYLFAICEKSSIEPFLQSIAARSLCTHDEQNELGYKAVDLVYPKLGPEIGTPYRIDFVKMLMKNDKYKSKAKKYFCDIINDEKIDCDYRYKTILGLEYKPEYDSDEIVTEEMKKKDEKRIEQIRYFIQEACLEFFKKDSNLLFYRILAGQNLLRMNCGEREYIEQTMLQFAKNVTNEYNLRADAADVLLQLSSDSVKKAAKDIIMELGIGKRTINTIYDNAQNVHTKEVDNSIKDALEFLQSFEIMKYSGKTITFDYVEKKIMELVKEEKKKLKFKKGEKYDKEEKIKVAINRINMDRSLYSKYSCTLSNILLRVWTYISGHDKETELQKRLLEELIEMSGTCSSGFVSRLVNTMSGFGDFSMKISWCDQIIANLAGRLNARIRDMDNLSLQEKVLSQMTLESSKYEERKHFLKFFRQNMLDIRTEMYNEFKTYISDTDFDLYFRAAVSMYESGQFS